MPDPGYKNIKPVQPLTPPFWGRRVIRGILLAEIIPYIDKKVLARGRWQLKVNSQKIKSSDIINGLFEPKFQSFVEKVTHKSGFSPEVYYGYFQCQSRENQLLVYENPGQKTPAVVFDFPRQKKKNNLCLADYFQAESTGIKDILAVQLVTMGKASTDETKMLLKQEQFQDYFFQHGFMAALTEALAEYWHKQIRRELGIHADDDPLAEKLFKGKYRGKRYSPGYPAFPNLEDQEKIFTLLQPEKDRIMLTEEFQLVPEYSTSAIIVHHPKAGY